MGKMYRKYRSLPPLALRLPWECRRCTIVIRVPQPVVGAKMSKSCMREIHKNKKKPTDIAPAENKNRCDVVSGQDITEYG